MNMKLKLEKDKFIKLAKKASAFWIAQNQWIFFSIWILLTVFVSWIWYLYVYQYQWSENEKNVYIKEQGQGIVLQEGKYQKILDNTAEKLTVLEKIDDTKVKDIFGL